MSTRAWILQGDCLESMRKLPDNSLDSVVTDPPYELGFMGKKWDASGIAFSVELWREVLRVLKPGGHLLAFSGTRTYHRMVCAIEDAGFEIRDQLAWMYGSGFPKSLDVAKQDGCEQWSGWGTALKPAQEPIVLARKPLIGTVAANVLAHGTGGINVDGCRIETTDNLNGGAYSDNREISTNEVYGEYKRMAPEQYAQPAGRWPANVLLDESAAELLDAQSGVRAAGARPAKRGGTMGYGGDAPMETGGRITFEAGGASRFFYVAKASRSEREGGLDHLPKHTAGELTDRAEGSDGLKSPRAGAGRTSSGRANNHPTVKPIALMRDLVRLVTPPGGTVLDPFAGSGTTLVAAVLEGFFAVGCEKTPEYIPIIEGRLAHASAS